MVLAFFANLILADAAFRFYYSLTGSHTGYRIGYTFLFPTTFSFAIPFWPFAMAY
ncbi:hypothetical protein ADIS_3339 [Lunatimonas lonarensis]|uniref:Uncharacterized protein n=1 Tax=Lunatimonas lonarensis TaxID=1232681 RepID=R7ZQ02_9BACT|nr:hypothetical protein ADIS_3339 [Lunatimonas lonarensis]